MESINVNLIKKFKEHINCILNFLQNPKTSYKYNNLLADTKVDILSVADLPDEFFLFLSDKQFCHYTIKNGRKIYHLNSLNLNLSKLLFDFQSQWEYFTGDHCHPIPVKKDFNKAQYNAGLSYYFLRKKNLYWVGENLILRTEYLQEFVKYLDVVLEQVVSQVESM